MQNTINKKDIIVIMGGPSEEHEISLKTGFEMITHLNINKYTVHALVIDMNKQFIFAPNCPNITLKDLTSPLDSALFNAPVSPTDSAFIWKKCDLAFLGLHGEFGEDGTIQGFLKTLDIPYTGCGVTASAIGMHKTLAKKVFEASGIPTAPYSVYRRGDNIERIALQRGLPCFVKAPQSGSSKLLGRADTLEDLTSMLAEFIETAPSVLVETLIKGDEFSCPVLEKADGSVQALPPVYIKPAIEGHFFDYEAKYEGASEEIVPAPFDTDLLELIQQTAVAVHTVLECRGLSRTDVIVNDGIPYVLEVNTLPGFTPQSRFPKSYEAEGGNFSQLLDEIIDGSIK